jgi:hypothetical protein
MTHVTETTCPLQRTPPETLGPRIQGGGELVLTRYQALANSQRYWGS